MGDIVKVGLIGSGFVADLHAYAFKHHVTNAEVIAVASPSKGKAASFAKKRGIPNAFEDYRELLKMKEIDVVSLGIPNDLHHSITIDAARAGKHVICEKPLCRSIAQADEMIDTCKKEGVLLLYAEEMLFAPKYVRAKQLVNEGAIGEPFLAKQWEQHSGPHSPWFWDINRSGGGALLDMGCHCIEFTRWALGKRKVKSVNATIGTFVHGARTKGDDHAICIVEYEGNKIGVAECSWATPGGVDDRCEIYGSGGNTRADLLRGSSLLTYSKEGYGYAMEKADITQGWTFTMFEETWNFGFPQEMQHFVNCIHGIEEPMETGDDGREVLKIILAAYDSAGQGKKITWPYDPPDVDKPIDLWLK